MSKTEDLATTNMEKAEILNKFFASVFTSNGPISQNQKEGTGRVR